MSVRTVSVTRVSQLEVGAYYVIKGTGRGKFPLPPQVLLLEEKDIHPTLTGVGHVRGTLWWRMWGKKVGVSRHHLLTLYELNIPEHGQHDIHLERVLEARLVRGVVGAMWYQDVAMAIHQKLHSVANRIRAI